MGLIVLAVATATILGLLPATRSKRLRRDRRILRKSDGKWYGQVRQVGPRDWSMWWTVTEGHDTAAECREACERRRWQRTFSTFNEMVDG